jgi:hypothetical protein
VQPKRGATVGATVEIACCTLAQTVLSCIVVIRGPADVVPQALAAAVFRGFLPFADDDRIVWRAVTTRGRFMAAAECRRRLASDLAGGIRRAAASAVRTLLPGPQPLPSPALSPVRFDAPPRTPLERLTIHALPAPPDGRSTTAPIFDFDRVRQAA